MHQSLPEHLKMNFLRYTCVRVDRRALHIFLRSNGTAGRVVNGELFLRLYFYVLFSMKILEGHNLLETIVCRRSVRVPPLLDRYYVAKMTINIVLYLKPRRFLCMTRLHAILHVLKNACRRRIFFSRTRTRP